MDTFTIKFNNIFNYKGENNIFKVFKSETLLFLNDNNLKNVDYKSVGALFGMNYNQEGIKNIDILVKLEYDFYILKKLIKDLLIFYSKRKYLTTKNYIEIIKHYAFDEYELNKSINKQNERIKFKVLQKKIWIPLYYIYEKKNNYKLNNTNIIDNNNNNNNNNNNKIMENNNIFDDEMNTWKSINKKKTYKNIKNMNFFSYNENIEKEEGDILKNNKFNKLINDNDNDYDNNEYENDDNEECYNEKEDYEYKNYLNNDINENNNEKENYESEEDEIIKGIKERDRKKFNNYKIYNKNDLEYISLQEKKDKNETNMDKIINNIKSKIRLEWADIIVSESE